MEVQEEVKSFTFLTPDFWDAFRSAIYPKVDETNYSAHISFNGRQLLEFPHSTQI
ncbi:MAG: hypothetical protein ACW98D_09615 [Promethearchaeota archaeon]|jgi:hypothetical protein